MLPSMRGDGTAAMIRRRAPCLLPGLLLFAASCGGGGARPASPAPERADWRQVATPSDRERLRGWRTAWTQALAKGNAAGHGREILAEGALLRPDAALPDPLPPLGRYRCRVIKLGAQRASLPDYVTYPAFDCRISAEGDAISFAKLTGSQRPAGLLFTDGQPRRIFLGTLMLGDERKALDYGRDRDRDAAGILERVAPQRWRLVLPYPHWESTLDVIELVPAG
jgi:hypothetical protein